MKAIKITNYVATGLLSAMLIVGSIGYVFNYDFFYESFTSLGYPTYLIYPIAIAKTLAVIAMWVPKMPTVKEWAYAGLAYDFLLALSAHLNVGHEEYMAAVLALVILSISYFTYRKLKAQN